MHFNGMQKTVFIYTKKKLVKIIESFLIRETLEYDIDRLESMLSFNLI